jgi:hypothetical protein
LLSAIANGELHLTGVLMLGPHLTPENLVEVLGRAKVPDQEGAWQIGARAAPAAARSRRGRAAASLAGIASASDLGTIRICILTAGKQGPHTVENVTLHCPAHNALAAELDFGREHMAERRDPLRHESLASEERVARREPAGATTD